MSRAAEGRPAGRRPTLIDRRKAAEAQTRAFYRGLSKPSPDDPPRPAWMEDPSLLPKRPPTRAA